MQSVYSSSLTAPKEQADMPQKTAELAGAWLISCGYHIDVWHRLGAAHVTTSGNSGLLAAALDLLRLLDSTHEGRQAIANLCDQPVLENTKS